MSERKIDFRLDLEVEFLGGDDEVAVLAEFYSHAQKAKESEEVLADELQILARKVISKKPSFHNNLDSMLEQWYVSQLSNHNRVLIAKMLLLQMSKVSLTN